MKTKEKRRLKKLRNEQKSLELKWWGSNSNDISVSVDKTRVALGAIFLLAVLK